MTQGEMFSDLALEQQYDNMIKALDMKEETLEEVIGIKSHNYSMQYVGTDKYTVSMLAIEFGYHLALEQQGCSEEDMKKAYCNGANLDYNIMISTKEGNEILDKWFEQFKKK